MSMKSHLSSIAPSVIMNSRENIAIEPAYKATLRNNSVLLQHSNKSLCISLEYNSPRCNVLTDVDDSTQLELGSVHGHGLIGIYNLSNCHYVAIISAYSDMYDINPYIKRISEVSLLRLPGSPATVNSEEIRLLHRAFASHSIYFSTHPHIYDVTLSMQRNSLRSDTEQHFVWNTVPMQTLRDTNLTSWCTPITNAMITSTPIEVDNKKYSLKLIARRSSRRQGSR